MTVLNFLILSIEVFDLIVRLYCSRWSGFDAQSNLIGRYLFNEFANSLNEYKERVHENYEAARSYVYNWVG